LRKPNWEQIELQPIQKEFYTPTQSVSHRDQACLVLSLAYFFLILG
jgi:hypothetical protein